MPSKPAGARPSAKESTDAATSDVFLENSSDGWSGSLPNAFGQDIHGTGLDVTSYLDPAGAPTSSSTTITISSINPGDNTPGVFAAENITFAGSGLVFHNSYDSTVD